jgi:hypothetical protein
MMTSKKTTKERLKQAGKTVGVKTLFAVADAILSTAKEHVDEMRDEHLPKVREEEIEEEDNTINVFTPDSQEDDTEEEEEEEPIVAPPKKKSAKKLPKKLKKK